MKKEIRKGYVALGIVSLFWGSSYVASKIGNAYMPAIFLAGIRQFFTGLILTAFFLCKKHRLPSRNNLKKFSSREYYCFFSGTVWLRGHLNILAADWLRSLQPSRHFL